MRTAFGSPGTGVLRGAAAGLAATAAMSAVMVTSERLGVQRGQPPRMIVDRITPAMREGTADAVAVAAHAAFGAGAGAAFGVLLPSRARGTASGIAFGLALWATAYEFGVPVLGVLPPAHRDHRGRVTTMLVAHVVYGAVLGRLSRP